MASTKAFSTLNDYAMSPHLGEDIHHQADQKLATILVIDSEEINRRLLRAVLRGEPYRILECRRAHEAIAILEAERVDLVIVDLMLPEVSGPEFCRWMKSGAKTQLTPVLMLTNIQGIENEITGISSGANEFLIKPLHPAVVRARVSAMLRQKALIDSLEEAETILFALAQAVEQRDTATGTHCQRLATMSVMLGRTLSLPPEELTALFRGGYLHDIGKVSMPDSILFKKGALSEQEWVIMRMHPLKGEEICRPMKSLGPVLPIIRNHHERWDGSGYPDGLERGQTPLLARILQVTDIYDALVTVRPYKIALSHADALQMLEEEVRKGWRDPELVRAFIATLSENTAEQLDEISASLEDMRSQLLL
jgi:putative two-component system response regulator